MTTTHKNRAPARRATAIGAERAGFYGSTASVPAMTVAASTGGAAATAEVARNPRTYPAGGRVTPPLSWMAQFRLNLPALVVGAGLLSNAQRPSFQGGRCVLHTGEKIK